jgi:hypothetical protein
MQFDFVSLVGAGDDPLAQVVISKADPDLEEKVGDKIEKGDLAPEVIEYIDALEDEVDSLSKSLVDEQAKNDSISKADSDDFDELIKSAEPAVAKLLTQQRDTIAKAEKRADEERDARLSKEYISKAEALPMLIDGAAGKDDLAGLLRRAADKLTPEDSLALEKMLSTANEQIAKGGLFSEFGKSGEVSTISKSVEAAAEAIRKGDPKLTIEQATARAYTENPDLFKQAMSDKEA